MGTLVQPEDKAASATAASHFVNYTLISGSVGLAGAYYLSRNSKMSSRTRSFCMIASFGLGSALGLRITSYSKASSCFMDLKTPTGEYAREQALLLLPKDNPIAEKIKKKWNYPKSQPKGKIEGYDV